MKNSFTYLGRKAAFVIVAHPSTAVGGIRNMLLRDPGNCSTVGEIADLGAEPKQNIEL